ncbi:MAG: hypothetical protein ACRDDL_06620 [Sarcina sp.]
MKLKWLIGAVIVVGIAAIGISYMVVSSNNSNNHNVGKAKPVITTTSNKQSANNDTNQNLSNTNNAAPKQNDISNSSNTNGGNKSTNSNNANSNNGEAKSTGNFDQIINGSKYMVGTLNGTSIIVPLQGGSINSSNQLILPAYSTNNLNEVLQLKISSIGNGNYDAYEFLNGNIIGTFKLKANLESGVVPSLSGTFSKPNSNSLEGINFNVINNQNIGWPLGSYPFYHCTIGGTPVNISVTGKINNFIERYQGDSNIFNLKVDYNLNKNDLGLVESYNGVTTGEYLFPMSNSNPSFNVSNGTFITKPGQADSKTYNVSLYGNYNPN